MKSNADECSPTPCPKCLGPVSIRWSPISSSMFRRAMPSRGEIMLRRGCVVLFLLVASCGYFADQAQAMYAPGVGRFISRDPIGYEGSPGNLYRAYFVPNGLDAEGTHDTVGSDG